MENSQSGTPKIDEKAISDLRKISISMIRKVLPSLIAEEIIGVQPMGLGPPVCIQCMIIGKSTNYKDRPWSCPSCLDFNLKGSLFTNITQMQQLLKIRSEIFESRVKTDICMKNTVHRKFMFPGDSREPNERYRPWLESTVGKQGELWNWNLAPSVTFDLLEIEFAESEHATLFKLTFPNYG